MNLSAYGNETFLLVDIASDRVCASLVLFPAVSKQSHPPQVIYSHREEIIPEKSGGSPKNSLDLVENTLSALHIALLATQKEGHSKAKKIYCFFSSPWNISQTRIIHFEKPNPTLVTEKMILSLIDQEKANLAQAVQNGEYGFSFNEPLRLIESKILSICLNGYEVTAPYGKSARTVDVSLFVSMVGKDFIQKVTDAIKNVFAHSTLEFHTFPIAAFSMIRDMNGDVNANPNTIDRNFLLLDIAGEVTDIGIVKRGILVQSLTLPIGKNFFVQGLMKRLRIAYPVALSLFQLHAQGKCDAATDQQLEDQLSKQSVEWQACFYKALNEIAQESFVPGKVFLVSDEDLLPFFSNMVSAQDFNQFSTQKNFFKPTIVNQEKLKEVYGTSSAGNKTTSVLLESLFIHKIRNASWQKIS